MYKHLRYFILLVSLTSLFQLSGCSRAEDNELMVFRYNETAGITSLDPAFARNQANMWVVHQLYSTLVEVDDQLRIRPALARRWEISEDGRKLTFWLHDDVYFHDSPVFNNGKGRKLVASDVVYSFRRLMEPSTASPGAWVFNNRVRETDPFIARNDSVFELHLKDPFVQITGILTMPYCSIVPQEAVEYFGKNFRANPVGTGPFKLLKWQEGRSLLCAKHEQYFERDSIGEHLPYLDRLHVFFYDSKATEFLEFRQKKLDFINDIDASFKDEVLTRTGKLKMEWDGKMVLHKHPYLNIEYLGIMLDSSFVSHPLQGKKLRQAVQHAINRDKLILYMRNSIGFPAEHGFIPPGLAAHDPAYKPYPHDPAKARQLLEEADYFSSRPEITIVTIPQYANLGVFIAGELEQVGMKVKVDVVQKSLLLQKTAIGTVPFFRGSWIADYPDAENFLSVFYGSNPSPPNYTCYRNPEFDVLYLQAVAEKNDSVRNNVYRAMNKMVMEDSPVIPLWYDMVVHLVQPEVEGFFPNALNMPDLRRVKKKNSVK